MNSLTAFLDKLRDEPALQQRLSAIFALPEAERPFPDLVLPMSVVKSVSIC